MEQQKKRRKLAYVEANMLRSSRILPNRETSPELAESIRQDGILFPIIVRPSPHEDGVFEIIDGGLRYQSIQENQKVLVDIRFDLDDSEIFKLSEATFKRKRRTTFERAKFYDRWVKAVEAANGKRGAQTKTASKAGLSQAELSHYLSISRLFERLQSQKAQDRIFNALKNQAVNKLYALSKVNEQSALLEVAAKMAEEPDMNLQNIRHLIDESSSIDREIERTLEQKAESEEDESIWEFRLRKATEELEGALDQTERTLATLNTKIKDNPHQFLSHDIVKRIKSLQKALGKIKYEVSRIIYSSKKSGGKDGAEAARG